jgi:hypothetical protein
MKKKPRTLVSFATFVLEVVFFMAIATWRDIE